MRLLGLTLAAPAALVMLTAVASAGKLSSSTQGLRAVWARMDLTGGFGTVECPVTLSGSLHSRTIAKTADGLIGYITDARVGACLRVGATVLTETLPWHVTYKSFSGTLPNISQVVTNIIGFALAYREPTFGIQCLLRSTPASPVWITYTRNTASGTISGTIPCSEFTTRLSGTGAVDNGAGTAITITLI